jgi:uncharacterized protein
MSLETWEAFLRQYMTLCDPPYFFVWQGGEPTLMGLSFYRSIVELEARVARETNQGRQVQIGNAIQTNAVSLDDEWARFFKEWHFFVGVSIDGPARWHDLSRTNASGNGTHARAMAGVDVLRRHRVDFNVLVVVSRANVRHARELLAWLVEQGFDNLQFSPCAEPALDASGNIGRVTPESVTPEEYGDFLVEMFDAWLELGPERVRIRWFDNLAQMLWGRPSQMCQSSPMCGYVVLEHNGDCYPCDFLVESEWKLGNVRDTSLDAMIEGERFSALAKAKGDLHPRCAECPWLTLCYGECPRYRIVVGEQAGHSLPYLCDSYRHFFERRYEHLERTAVRMGRSLGLDVPEGHMPPSHRVAQNG